MRVAALLLALVAAGTAEPVLHVAARWEPSGLRVELHLSGPLPEAMEKALPSGAVVRVLYPLKVRSRRRLWWDKKLFSSEAESLVAFDPLTGRYRCQFRLGDVVISVHETASIEAARGWLTDPPPFHIVIARRRPHVRIEARAIFASGTTWLVFPSSAGTEWVEAQVPAEDDR